MMGTPVKERAKSVRTDTDGLRTHSSRHRVTFLVNGHETEWGDHIVLVGSSSELGNWDPHAGIRLKTHQGIYPVWIAKQRKLTAPGRPSAGWFTSNASKSAVLEFKFVIVRTSGEIEWEGNSNRRLDLSIIGGGCDVVVSCEWGSADIDTKLLVSSLAAAAEGSPWGVVPWNSSPRSRPSCPEPYPISTGGSNTAASGGALEQPPCTSEPTSEASSPASSYTRSPYYSQSVPHGYLEPMPPLLLPDHLGQNPLAPTDYRLTAGHGSAATAPSGHGSTPTAPSCENLAPMGYETELPPPPPPPDDEGADMMMGARYAFYASPDRAAPLCPIASVGDASWPSSACASGCNSRRESLRDGIAWSASSPSLARRASLME